MTDKDWYSYSEIIFTRDEIIWIIANLEDADSWPPDFKVTGYTGKKRGGLNKRALFDNPRVISAEVNRRLDATGEDGKLLKWQVKAGITTFEYLESEAQCALNFMSVWDFRKRPSYTVFRKNWRYYQKIKRKTLKQT